MIKACLNGDRTRADHPAVPVTATELATAARRAVDAGADAIHMHPRAADETQSLAAADIGAAVTAVRAACGATPIGVSTGLWITGDGGPTARLALVNGWSVLPPATRPDFASVNMSEPGVADLVTALHALGIGAEAGVWSTSDAAIAAATRPPAGWHHVLVEVRDDGPPAADAILAALEAHTVDGRRIVHGEGPSCWPVLAHAGELGCSTRIGLEDILTGPLGEPVADNAELVRHGIEVWTASRRESAR